MPTSRASSSSSEPDSSEPASPFRTFEEDVGGGRAIASLRLLGAAVVLAGGVWLVVSTPTAWAAGIALLALLAAVGWIAGYVRSRRRTTPKLLLRLTPEAIEIVLAERIDRAPWVEVSDVVIDEDRLVVRIERHAGEPLVLEPLWRGLGAYALADAIRAAWEASQSGDPELPARSKGTPP